MVFFLSDLSALSVKRPASLKITWLLVKASQHNYDLLLVKASLQRPCDSTYALVFPVDVLQVEPFMALADVTTKCVDAFPEPGTHCYSCCTLIHICMRKMIQNITMRKYSGEHTMYSSFSHKVPFFELALYSI